MGICQSEGGMNSARKNICRLRFRRTVLCLLCDQTVSPRTSWSLKSLVLMIWSQGRKHIVCSFLILFVETNDIMTIAKMLHVTMLTVIHLMVKNTSLT